MSTGELVLDRPSDKHAIFEGRDLPDGDWVLVDDPIAREDRENWALLVRSWDAS